MTEKWIEYFSKDIRRYHSLLENAVNQGLVKIGLSSVVIGLVVFLIFGLCKKIILATSIVV